MAKYDSPYSGSGSLTREQFLFHETKIVAKLMVDDQLSDDEIVDRVVGDGRYVRALRFCT